MDKTKSEIKADAKEETRNSTQEDILSADIQRLEKYVAGKDKAQDALVGKIKHGIKNLAECSIRNKEELLYVKKEHNDLIELYNENLDETEKLRAILEERDEDIKENKRQLNKLTRLVGEINEKIQNFAQHLKKSKEELKDVKNNDLKEELEKLKNDYGHLQNEYGALLQDVEKLSK